MSYHSTTSIAKKSCCDACASHGMGDAPAAVDMAPTLLRAQVNRFLGDGAPPAFALGAVQVPPAGPVDMQVATYAAVLYQRRAADAVAKDPTLSAMIDRGNAALANPVDFVTKNIAEVTATVQAFADLNGVPAAGGFLGLPTQFAGIPTTYVIGAAAGLAILALMSRRRKR